MKDQNLHYYTVRNRVTGDKSLVRSTGRTRALNGFAKRRLEVTLTSQQELLDLHSAGVNVLDLSKAQPEPFGDHLHVADGGGAAGS